MKTVPEEIAALIKRGHDFAEEYSGAFIRANGLHDEMSKVKLKLYLSTKAMFPQLNDDECANVAELMTCADVNALKVIDGVSEELRRALDSERINLWNAARDKFISQNLLLKLDETQKAFAEIFLLRTRSH